MAQKKLYYIRQLENTTTSRLTLLLVEKFGKKLTRDALGALDR